MKPNYSQEKRDAVVKTKNYRLISERIQKLSDNDSEKYIHEQLEELILNYSKKTFSKYFHSLVYVVDDLFKDGVLSLEEKELLIQKLELKSTGDLTSKEIDFDSFYKRQKLLKDVSIIDVSKENTLSLISLPFMLNSNMSDCLSIKYKNVTLQTSDNGILLTYTQGDKETRVSLDEKLSSTYETVFNSLKEKFGDDDFVFLVNKAGTWDSRKNGKYIHMGLFHYIESSNQSFKSSSFITPFREILNASNNCGMSTIKSAASF